MEMRKQSKNATEVLRKKCVTKAKLIARRKVNFTCAYCGAREPQVRTHGSHIYSEGIYRAMSADVDNILCLCATHHLVGIWNRSTHWSWHGSPAEAMDWFKGKYPALAEELRVRTTWKYQDDLYFWTKKLENLKKEEAELSPV